MTTPIENTELHQALTALEIALLAPVVPGELERWIDSARKGFDRLSPLLSDQIESVHKQQFADVEKKDPGLMHRVEQMRTQDQENLRRLGELTELLDQLSVGAENVEPDESKIDPAIERFVDDGISFVLQVRRQEVAAKTWFVEAYNRDRGFAD